MGWPTHPSLVILLVTWVWLFYLNWWSFPSQDVDLKIFQLMHLSRPLRTNRLLNLRPTGGRDGPGLRTTPPPVPNSGSRTRGTRWDTRTRDPRDTGHASRSETLCNYFRCQESLLSTVLPFPRLWTKDPPQEFSVS